MTTVNWLFKKEKNLKNSINYHCHLIRKKPKNFIKFIRASKTWYLFQMTSSCITFEKTTRRKFISCLNADVNKISTSNTFLKNIPFKINLKNRNKCAWKYSEVYLNFMLTLGYTLMKSHLHVLKSTVEDSSTN
jgi:hypothetical protein